MICRTRTVGLGWGNQLNTDKYTGTDNYTGDSATSPLGIKNKKKPEGHSESVDLRQAITYLTMLMQCEFSQSENNFPIIPTPHECSTNALSHNVNESEK